MVVVKYWFRIAFRVVIVCSGGLACVAYAEARAELAVRLAALESFAAEFEQSVQGANGALLERSTGSIRMAKPKFKWSVAKPYPQVIASDGVRLSVYDPDLAQVIVRPLDEALRDTPITLLTSNQVQLGDDFDVIVLPGETEVVYLLTPRDTQSLYAEIRLHFAGLRQQAGTTAFAPLSRLGILDHLGQFTEIVFRNVRSPAVIESSEFELNLPTDVDVING